MARTPRLRDAEDSLAVRAAWLHYAGGLTQAEVAKRLGITSVKAHRLITKLAESGAIKVTIDGDVAEIQRFDQTAPFGPTVTHDIRWLRAGQEFEL